MVITSLSREQKDQKISKIIPSLIRIAINHKTFYNINMIRIRRLTCFDIPKLKKLISYLCTDENDKLAKNLTQESVGFINAMLPLHLKFKSESFIITQDKEILGLITINCTHGNPEKINITRLIFKENRYDIGKNLVEFVVQKLGAKGAATFTVTIDESHQELFDLFINGCGFRQCASETLWKIEKPTPVINKFKLNYAQNSDSKRISQLYNSEIISIYKNSLQRDPKEFTEPLFQGFVKEYKTRYILEESKKLLGYFSITTCDNLNYILDITTNSGYEFDYDDLINFLLCEIAKKKHAFYPFIKQKKYTKESEKFEEYLKAKGFLPVQTRQILVRDFYKPIAETTGDWEIFILGENRVRE